MLSPKEISGLHNRTKEIYYTLLEEKSRFIENGTNPSFFDWLGSKGTSFDCYVKFIDQNFNSDVQVLNNKIDQIRMVFYAFLKPFQSTFFYWTLLLFIMYKFNFKRPILKLVFYHYTLRAIGDIIDQLGNLLPYYHSIKIDGTCNNAYTYTEQHPLRWFLTRQINSFFWYTGEIIGDWYPLLRTKPVTKNRSSLILLYSSCILYNLSKLAVPISQLFVSPAKLYQVGGDYNSDYVNNYYNIYWFLQAVISFTTFIYEFVIYRTLNKELFSKTSTQEYGFLKKFRSVSEYRIIVSALVALIAFPILFAVSALKIYFYYTDRKEINCSVEDFRGVVTNVQYMIIFIDQILLLNTKYVGKNGVPTYSEINSNNMDYNTGILHSQDANVKKIVFKEEKDDSDKTDIYYDGVTIPNEAYYNNNLNNNYPIRFKSYPLN